MATAFFVTADFCARSDIIETIKEKLIKNAEYVDVDENLLLELILGIDSSNEKLSRNALSVFAMVLKRTTYNKCSKALPFIMDFMGRCSHNSDGAQKLFEEFLRCAPSDQKMKIVEEGLSHPLWKTNVVTMKSVSDEDISHLGSSIEDRLKSLCNSKMGKQVCQHASDLMKKMKLGGSNCELVTNSAESNRIEKFFEECLSEDPKCNVNNESIDDIKYSIRSDSDMREKIEALKRLRSQLGLTGFNTISASLRQALFHNHPEVIKQACATTVFLLVKKKISGTTTVENFIQPLIKCIDSLSEEVSLWAFVALKFLVKEYCTSNMLVNIIFNVNSKSSRIRRKVGELLRSKLGDFPKPVLEGCTLLFEQSIKVGISDEDPEVREEWKKLLCVASKLFEKMAERIYFDVIYKVRTENGASCKDQISDQDHVDINGVKLTEIAKLSSGKFSGVISAKFLGRKVAVRKIVDSDYVRYKKEVDVFKMTENSANFTPMMFELQFSGQKGIVMPYYENLVQAVNNRMLLHKESKIRVIHKLAKGLNYIHSLGIVHCSLEPQHIFVNYSHESFEVKIRNFGRSILESQVPHHPPSPEWSDPKALMLPGYFSKGTDIFSLGLVAYFVWSSGQDHRGKVIPGSDVIGDLDLEDKSRQAKMAIIQMTSREKPKKINEILMFPVFWKNGSYRYFVERLREMLRRSKALDYINKEGLDWTKLVPDEFREDMVVSRGLNDNSGHLVMFLRNLSIHGAETYKRRKITGVCNKKLEGWIKNNFEELLEKVFSQTYKDYDAQLVSELQSICIQ